MRRAITAMRQYIINGGGARDLHCYAGVALAATGAGLSAGQPGPGVLLAGLLLYWLAIRRA